MDQAHGQSIYLSIDLSIYLFIYRSINLSIYLSIYLSIHLSIFQISIILYLFIYPYIPLSIYLSFYIPMIYLYVSLSLSIYLSIYPSKVMNWIAILFHHKGISLKNKEIFWKLGAEIIHGQIDSQKYRQQDKNEENKPCHLLKTTKSSMVFRLRYQRIGRGMCASMLPHVPKVYL